MWPFSARRLGSAGGGADTRRVVVALTTLLAVLVCIHLLRREAGAPHLLDPRPKPKPRDSVVDDVLAGGDESPASDPRPGE